MKISRGIHLHRLYTPCQQKSHSINPRVCTYLEITLMKYGRNWPRIFSLNACSIFLKNFFSQNPVKSRSTPKIPLSMCYDLGKSIPNIKAIHGNLLLLDPNLSRLGAGGIKITRGPWALTFCLRSNFRINLFSLYGQQFPRYRPDFQNYHIWAWNLAIGQSYRSCSYTMYTLFLPQGGQKWTYFCSTWSGFRDTGGFSKFPYLGMKLCHWQKYPEVTHNSPFLPQGIKIELMVSGSIVGSAFRDMGRFWKSPYLGMKPGHCPKFQKLHICCKSQNIRVLFISRDSRSWQKCEILWARINFRVAAMITLGVCVGKYGSAL